MARRPTIVDVARRAGVSKSTVSLVLQRSPLVRASTRGTVEAAMDELGYVYNRAAANLRSAGAGLVGLVINDLRNPFFTEFATSAQMAFAREGLATVVANTDEDPVLQAQVIDTVIEHGVSALLVSPAYGAPQIGARIARAGVPAMQVLRRADGAADLPFASLDYHAGSRLAGRHLLELGARRIAFVGGLPDREVTLERLSGLEEVAAAAGLPVRTIHGRPSRGFGREAALSLAAEAPRIDAVVCFSDLVALGMLSGFQEAGVAVGRDVRVVGFDDIEDCALVYPQLTSVRCDIARFGEASAEAMLAWLNRGERPPAVSRAPVTLVARASTLGG